MVSICEIRNCFLIQQTVSSVSHCYHLHGMTIAIASGCGTTHCLSQLLNLPHNHLYLPHTPRDRPTTETSQQTEAAGRSVNHSHVCRHQCRIVPRQLTPDWLPPTDRGKVVVSISDWTQASFPTVGRWQSPASRWPTDRRLSLQTAPSPVIWFTNVRRSTCTQYVRWPVLCYCRAAGVELLADRTATLWLSWAI